MDTVGVTLRLDRPTAERLRADPGERLRHEAFPGLIASAKSKADVDAAVTLFTAPPAERQKLLMEAFEAVGRAAEEAGVTPEDVEAELAAWKRERSAS